MCHARIALTRRLDDAVPAPRAPGERGGGNEPRGNDRGPLGCGNRRDQPQPRGGSFAPPGKGSAPLGGALADAFARAKQKS